MSHKPINENIRSLRIEDEAGDLRSLLDYAGEQFADVVKAVEAHGKAGSLTLKINLKPSAAGALAVKSEVKIVKPKGLPAESLLWPTPEGNLVAEDPRQERLELREVQVEKPRELKAVAAA